MPLICQTLFYIIWICMSMRQAKFSAPVWGIHSQPTPHFQNPFISPNSELQCSVVHTGLLLLQLFAHTLFGLFSKESLILCLPVSKLGSFHDLFNSFCTLRLIPYSWLFQGIQEGERGNFVSNIPPWLEAAVSNFTQRAHHLSIWRPVMHLAFGQPPPVSTVGNLDLLLLGVISVSSTYPVRTTLLRVAASSDRTAIPFLATPQGIQISEDV